MNPDERFQLVTRNAQEIVTEDELRDLLKKKKHPLVYLGTAITGRPHIGYFVWATKMADFMRAGFKVKVLLADIHGALDNTPWDLLEKRYAYYEEVIPGLFDAIGAERKKLDIIRGSSFQLRKDYVLDVLKMATFASVHDATKAASEVVKMGDSPKLAGIIYPLMQSVDEEYLGVDVQYGGIDQRKILVFAREMLPKIGYRPRVEFMTPLVPSLSADGKMSSSKSQGKIDLLDDPKTVEEKLKGAYCEPGKVEGNGVLAFCKYVVMVHKEDRGETLDISRPEKFGGSVSYKTYSDLEADYAAKKLHPMDLKTAVAREINKLLDPIRKRMKGREKLIREAYP